MMTCQEGELDSVEQVQIPVRQVMLHLAECQIRCNEMWEAALRLKGSDAPIVFFASDPMLWHQSCSKRAENRPHGRDADYLT
jgi:hypothetical protein